MSCTFWNMRRRQRAKLVKKQAETNVTKQEKKTTEAKPKKRGAE